MVVESISVNLCGRIGKGVMSRSLRNNSMGILSSLTFIFRRFKECHGVLCFVRLKNKEHVEFLLKLNPEIIVRGRRVVMAGLASREGIGHIEQQRRGRLHWSMLINTNTF